MSSFDEAVRLSKDLPSWNQVVEVIEEAPHLPSTIQKILNALEKGADVDLKTLSKIIETDAGLASKILKVANSALFNSNRTITNIINATSVIGLKTLKGILISTALKDLQTPDTEFLKYAWKKSYLTCKLLRQVASYTYSLDAEDLATLGLVHNLGEIIIGGNIKFRKSTVIAFEKAISEKGGLTFSLEDATGFKPSLVSALLLKKWNFPESLCLHTLHRDSPSELLNWDEEMLLVHRIFQVASFACEIKILAASNECLEYRMAHMASKSLPGSLKLDHLIKILEELMSDPNLDEIG